MFSDFMMIFQLVLSAVGTVVGFVIGLIIAIGLVYMAGEKIISTLRR